MIFRSINKKIILSFFILLAIIAVAFYSLFYFHTGAISDIFFRVSNPEKKAYKENPSVHLYGNEQVPLGKVLIRTYYVVAKDKRGSIIKNWQASFKEALTKVCQFYEFQFADNMKMNFRIYPQIIHSSHDADYFTDLAVKDYEEELTKPHSPSLLLESILRELKTGINDKDKKWDLSAKTEDDAYIVNLVILAAGGNSVKTKSGEILGLNNEKNDSLVFSVIFTNPKFKRCYESVIAHEIGHGLGIPEFYVIYSDKVKTSGVMGEGLTRRIENNYLDSRIKEKME